MSILCRLLPKCVDFRLAGRIDDVGETFGLCLENFHEDKKSARELRQGGSDYRCCIPALAGFVSPQSIAPDGEQMFAQLRYRASAEKRRSSNDECRINDENCATIERL